MATKTSKICDICASKKSNILACPFCFFSSCKTCIQKYLLSLPDDTPKCMSCSKGWSLDFIADNFSIAFYNTEYRNYRANIVFQREQTLLPETQEFASRYRENKNIMEKIRAKMETIAELKRTINNLYIEIKNDEKTIWTDNDLLTRGSDFKNEEKGSYTGRCPVDECKGFLSTDKICGMCETVACKKCHKIKTDEHKCNDDDVQTIKLLKKDTKHCPSCSTPIFKISGCDQMWCPMCHIAFSWKSGLIEKGKVHNPHYYQWMRDHKTLRRDPDDIVCGGLIRVRDMYHGIPNVFYDIHQVVEHIQAVGILNTPPPNYIDLRAKYLVGDLTEKKWLTILKGREKKREKDIAVNMILTMFVNVLTDLFNNLMETRDEVKIEKDMVSLRDYVNVHLQKISRRFNNKTPHISEDWRFVL